MEESIFFFRDRPPLSIQDDSLCESLLDDFWKSIDEESTVLNGLPTNLKDKCPHRVVWKATYASVLVFEPIDSHFSFVWVIGLDGWQSKIHTSKIMGRQNISVPNLTQPAVFGLGIIATETVDKMLRDLSKVLQKSKEKSPSLVKSTIIDLMRAQKEEEEVHEESSIGIDKSSKGGTTHIESKEKCVDRSTSFPLVCSFIWWVLNHHGEDGNEVFYKCLVAHYTRHLRTVGESVATFDTRLFDRVTTIIRSIEDVVHAIRDETFKESVVQVVEEHYDNLLKLRPRVHEDDDQKPWSYSEISKTLRAPKMPKIPQWEKPPSDDRSKIDQARASAAVNVGLDVVSLSTTEFDDRIRNTYLQIATLDRYFWKAAEDLVNQKETYDISKLREELCTYSRHVKFAETQSKSTPHVITVRFRSGELLAIWISFCWAFHAAEEAHPMFRSYGSALDPLNLEFIVLADKRAISALECVRVFLQERSRKPCIPFKRFTDTLKLALQFGLQSKYLDLLYKSELEEANQLIANRWSSVQSTQQQLAELDRKLASAKVDLRRAENDFNISEQFDFDYGYRNKRIYRPVYYQNKQKVQNCLDLVRDLTQRINVLEQKPRNLLLGLPRERHQALQWSFFLFMPLEFRNLAALAQLGQSKLWKNPPISGNHSMSLLTWYLNNRKTSTEESPMDAEIILDSKRADTRVSTPQNIRGYSRETGVLFPDSFSIDPMWKNYDPFVSLFPRADATRLYTEELPRNTHLFAHMQTFLPMIPTKTRENEALALRHKKPEWLNQEQYITFSELRSHPYTQVRRLVEALHDDLLPFHDINVHILVKQLLYQVGSSDWKSDLHESWHGYQRLATELVRQLDNIRDSPKDCDRLLLFGVLSSFLGQFDEECMILSFEFCATARKWADHMAGECQVDGIAPQRHCKQAKLYAYALLCMSFGELNDENYSTLLDLVVLFRKNVQLAADNDDGRSVAHAVDEMMSRHVRGLTASLEKNTRPLTSSLSLIIDRMPRNLRWVPIANQSGAKTVCFEAECDDLYTINVFDGTVLINGVPPKLLPASVLSHNLYRRTFGDRNFVTTVSDHHHFRKDHHHFRTARLVENCYVYEFHLNPDGSLLICEEDDSNKDRLYLLERKNIDLPVMLCEQHSHWYSLQQQCILLRGINYRKRDVYFVMTQRSTFSVPMTFRTVETKELVRVQHDFDKLVMCSESCFSFLNDFEYPAYIHIFAESNAEVLRISLPRFKLSFSLKDKVVMSLEFKGFYIVGEKLLADTLPQIKGTIAMRNADGREKIILPQGRVQESAVVSILDRWDSDVRYFAYDAHRRFRQLSTQTTLGRLHLASLYASCACSVPELRFKKPATVIATQLVRSCWQNEPYSADERSKLAEVARHAAVSCSTLSLICAIAWRCSVNVNVLHGVEMGKRFRELDIDPFAVEDYVANIHAPRLETSEELLLFRKRRKTTIEQVPLERETSRLKSVRLHEEAMLKELVEVCANPTSPESMEFPLNCEGLETNMFEDIDESYKLYCHAAKHVPRFDYKKNVSDRLNQVRSEREEIEHSIVGKLQHQVTRSEHRMAICSGRVCAVSSLDMIRLIYDWEFAEQLLPYTEISKRAKVRLDCLGWAALCILEDRLHRISAAGAEEDPQALLSELTCARRWNPLKHPRWIAFEVEQCLQIRPDQYAIVEQLLRTPGGIIQLNMGLGKTRVVVPMIILEHMSDHSKVCRVNVLPSIIGEALGYYRRVLVASVQNVKLYSLPFTRDVTYDNRCASSLSDELVRCKQMNGAIIVTPQHRLSLLMKQTELQMPSAGFEDACFLDLLDESDALLSHEFELVYALGSQVDLPNGPSRWKLLEAFLLILCRNKSLSILSVVSDETKTFRVPTKCGSFSKLRFLVPFRGSEREFGIALCEKLIADPPYELYWIKSVGPDAQLLQAIMSDPLHENVLLSIKANKLFERNQSDILAARGLIAFGTLFHGLEARYRVNYGLLPGNQIKLAVPYSASDTPKLRTQYSHPDMCLIYTALSYLHEGLNRSQLKEALLYLQTELGPDAQKMIFGEFVEAIQEDVPLEVIRRFDDPQKVDVNNSNQFELLYEHMSNCMEVIFFWMDNFVFPTETKQFPRKLTTNAWNVCDKKAIGFSGTDDNRQLLPHRFVKQISPDQAHLRATNGEMISLIIRSTKGVRLLPSLSPKPLWEVVLAEATNNTQIQALIDVSGLMAGVPNDEVSLYLSKEIDPMKHSGVVYFDQNTNSWCVYELMNCRRIPLDQSAFTSAECFVYFDQSHCRGSDIKLPASAVALVTIEPKLTKDKFLQGCARMRKLNGGQSLILTGTPEAMNSTSTVKEVLETILRHTSLVIKNSLPMFYQRGLDYYRFPEPSIDDYTLEGMYGDQRLRYRNFAEFLDATMNVEGPREMEHAEYCRVLSSDNVDTGTLSGECEQELEEEAEKESEQEREAPVQRPFCQIDWNYEEAFSNPDNLFANYFVPLSKVIKSKVPDIAAIDWSEKVFCSPNFWTTIEASDSLDDLSLYLRPVKTMLVTNDGRIVLLSTYETDKLLPLWWKSNTMRSKATLQHLCFADDVTVGFGKDAEKASQDALTSAKLFRGYTSFTPEQTEILKLAFANVKEAQQIARQLLHIRNRLGYFARSDLELGTTLILDA